VFVAQKGISTDHSNQELMGSRLNHLRAEFTYWEKIEDLIDQPLGLTLNCPQSGYARGSRLKVHSLECTLLSGVTYLDIRHPEK
jgi:hypothetical protein